MVGEYPVRRRNAVVRWPPLLNPTRATTAKGALNHIQLGRPRCEHWTIEMMADDGNVELRRLGSARNRVGESCDVQSVVINLRRDSRPEPAAPSVELHFDPLLEE